MVKKLSFTSLLLTVAILAGCSTFKPKLADLNPLLNADKEKLALKMGESQMLVNLQHTPCLILTVLLRLGDGYQRHM